jgi:hypothetical protein
MMARERTTFEGREVIGTEITVSGVVADSDERDPYHVGDVVYLFAEIIVDRVSHKPVRDSDKLLRVEHGKSLVATIVDRALVSEAIELAKINAEVDDGIMRLGFDGGGGDE